MKNLPHLPHSHSLTDNANIAQHTTATGSIPGASTTGPTGTLQMHAPGTRCSMVRLSDKWWELTFVNAVEHERGDDHGRSVTREQARALRHHEPMAISVRSRNMKTIKPPVTKNRCTLQFPAGKSHSAVADVRFLCHKSLCNRQRRPPAREYHAAHPALLHTKRATYRYALLSFHDQDHCMPVTMHAGKYSGQCFPDLHDGSRLDFPFTPQVRRRCAC